MDLNKELSQSAAGAIVSRAVGYGGYSGKGGANDLLGVAQHANLHLPGGVSYRHGWDVLARQIEEPEEIEELPVAPSVVEARGSWIYLSDGTKHNGQVALKAYLAQFASSEDEEEEESVSSLEEEDDE